MSSQLTEEELAALMPSELVQHHTPIPTQIVSSDEFYPDPQNERQREVEARLLAMADDLGGKQGLDRRRFFQTAAGMAASFVAMNEVYGSLFEVSKAEAATPAMAQERANALKDQFIMDMHTHFLRDDTRIMTFVNMRNAVGKAGWNKQLAEREQTIEDLKFNNYKKEIFLDSDTKISLISSASSDIEQDWFLTNEQMAQARKKINDEAGSRRVFCHMIFTPGQPGWLDKLDAGLALKPESCKGYTIGDNTHKEISRYPWRMDDEKVAYKGYEKMVAAGSACTKDYLRPAWRRNFLTCAALLTWPTLVKRRRTGRSSTSSSTIRPTATSVAIRSKRWLSSSGPAASPGPVTSPIFRRSTASATCMATSASCSRPRWWPSPMSARP
jgi:hypothetical protein